MRRLLSVLTVALLLASAAVAQEMEEMKPVSYMAEFQVHPAKADTFVGMVKKHHKPLLDRLMSEGVVLVWGLDAAMIHRDDGANFLVWFVTADYAGMDTVFAGLEKMEAEMPKEDQGKIMETINIAKHHDHMLRAIHGNVSSTRPTGRLYTNYSTVRVKPGQGRAYLELYKKYTAPVLDGLVADGTIYGYGLDREDFHTEAPQWRFIWIVVPNLAAFDKVDAAFEAAREELSRAERSIMENQFREKTEPGEHRDYFFRSVLMPGGEAEMEGESQ
jgi:hypothetical protein